MNTSCLFERALACIMEPAILVKVDMTHETICRWNEGKLILSTSEPPRSIAHPGRPARLQLVMPKDLQRRSLNSKQGRAALIHALCHIEFNAVNLAWDAVYRFRDMPRAYYSDWLKVAGEEAYHFTLLHEYLASLGHEYGDFVAHDGLWEMAIATEKDPLHRMALVPRVLEARGLDVTPGMIARLEKAGDERAVEILNIIHRDEIEHVKIGTHWFHFLCQQRGLPREETFQQLYEQHMKGRAKGPLHREARLKAGFTEKELCYLEGKG